MKSCSILPSASCHRPAQENVLRTPLTKTLHELVIILLTLDLVLAVEGHAAGRPVGQRARGEE